MISFDEFIYYCERKSCINDFDTTCRYRNHCKQLSNCYFDVGDYERYEELKKLDRKEKLEKLLSK